MNGLQSYSPQNLAKLLDVSVNTIYRWIWKEKAPPYYKVGKLVRFNFEEVKKWQESNTKKSEAKGENKKHSA